MNKPWQMKRPFAVILLSALLSSLGFAQELRYHPVFSKLQYNFRVPEGWDHGVLVDKADVGELCHSGPTSVKVVATYKPTDLGIILGTERNEDTGNDLGHLVRIVSADEVKEGWVCADVVAGPTEASMAVQAKLDAVESLRRRRVAMERKRKEAARETEERAQKAAQEAERAKIRRACAVIYSKTIDRKISDLTVRESQEVQSCQVAGMYRPA